MIECIQRLITNFVERVGTQGAAEESLGTVPASFSPFGPFVFKGKVLGVQRPLATGAGHHSVACKPGTDEWYICYHRRPIPSKGRDHLVVCIDRMEFDANGDIKPIVMTK